MVCIVGLWCQIWNLDHVGPVVSYYSYLNYQVKSKDNLTGRHGVQLLCTQAGKKKQQSGGSRSKTQIKAVFSAPSIVLSSCLRYAFSEAMGFPLAASRADVLALWPADGLWSGQTGVLVSSSVLFFIFIFFTRPWSFFQGQNHIFFSAMAVQTRKEGEVLGNRRRGEE